MTDVVVELEYLWGANYQPWLSTNFPWLVLSNGSDSMSISTSVEDPIVIEGQGVTFNSTEDTLTIAIQDPTITEGLGVSFDTTVESVIISLQSPTITEGSGNTILVSTESLTLLAQNPSIEYDFTVFPNTESFTIELIPPSKIGLLWEIRIQPIEKWKTREQVLWSYDIHPWSSTFYPWLVNPWVQTSSWQERTKPETTFINRIKPTSGWSERTKPTTDWN